MEKFNLILPDDLSEILADVEPIIVPNCTNRDDNGKLYAPKNWIKYANVLVNENTTDITIEDLANIISMAKVGKITGLPHYLKYAVNLKDVLCSNN